MKLINYCIKCAVVSVVPLMAFLACTGKVTPVNHEPVSGNIVGKLQESDGTPAHGATVLLTSADFDPYTPGSSAKIDSTITDDNGAYTFILQSSGFFNVSARSRETYGFEDSVYGTEKGLVDLKTTTLKAPGSISGVVRLRPEHGSRSIIILVMGTAIYCSPADSTGRFSTPALAEGMYRLRFFTTEKGYGKIDTAVSVTSGEPTVMAGVLQLSFDGVPPVGAVTAAYDMPMSRVTLSWPVVDTTNVVKIYVFRNTGIAGKPIATLSRTETSYTDDLLLPEPGTLEYGDTLRYCIAACGQNNLTGKAGSAPEIVLEGFLKPIGTITTAGIDGQADNLFAVDNNHNIYLSGNGWIKKFDSTGRPGAEYCDEYCASGEYEENHSQITTDNFGNVYYYHWRALSLLRLSADLKVLSSLKLTKGLAAMKTDSSGRLYLLNFADTAGGNASVWILDSLLNITDSLVVDVAENGSFIMMEVNNGAVMYTGKEQSTAVTAHGSRFSRFLWSPDTNMLRNNYPYPIDESWVDKIDFLNDGSKMVAVYGHHYHADIVSDSEDKFVYFIDPSGRLIARSRVPVNYYLFDGNDRIYLNDVENRSIMIYRIMK